MTQKLSLFLLVSCSICIAQSAPNPQTDSTVPSSDWRTTGSPSRAYDNPQSTNQRPYVDPFGIGSNLPIPINQGPDRSSSRIAGPLTTKSEFESFAEDAAGHTLPVFG